MSGAEIARGAADLRRAFDESFAEAQAGAEEEGDLVLAVRAGDGRFAVRVAELEGMHVCGRIAALPGGPEGLLGIAGVRGRLVAVYDLAALLGSKGGSAVRFLLLAGRPEPIALGVEALEGHARVEAVAEDTPREHVTKVIRQGDVTRELLSVPSLLAAIARRAPAQQRGRRG